MAGTFDVTVLDTVNPLLPDLTALIRALLMDAIGDGVSLLDGYGAFVEIEKRSSTTVGLKAPSGSRARQPARIAVDGRIGIATSDPSPVTVSGGAGTKYIYADVSAVGAITLVMSATTPASESTNYRLPLGQVVWDGAAISSLIAYFASTPSPTDGDGVISGNAIIDNTIPSAAYGDLSIAGTKIANATINESKFAMVPAPRGYIGGLGLSNSAGDVNNDITVAVGTARAVTNDDTITLSVATTKRLDANWALGTDQGGLDNGTKAVSTWYHVFLIKRSDNGTVDALFSLSATTPAMPTNYDRKRRIGAVATDGSGNIIQFKQNGDRWRWLAPINDVAAAAPGTAAVTRALSVPAGVVVEASIAVNIIMAATATCWGLITSLDETDTQPDATHCNCGGQANTATEAVVTMLRVITNTSSQVRSRISTSTSMTLNINTFGYWDRRGQDD